MNSAEDRRGYSLKVLAALLLFLPLLSFGQTVGDRLRANAAAAAVAAQPTVTLAWNASPSEEVIGYKIYWGNTNGVYTNSVVVGTNLTAQVPLLVGHRYYLAATAYGAEGQESIYSNELSVIGQPNTWVTIFSRLASSPGGPWTNAAVTWSGLATNSASLYAGHEIQRSNYVTWK